MVPLAQGLSCISPVTLKSGSRGHAHLLFTDEEAGTEGGIADPQARRRRAGFMNCLAFSVYKWFQVEKHQEENCC